MKYGKILKNHRKQHKMSQQELAKITGISQQSISFWEIDKHTPNIDDCVKLADFYGITVDELIGHEVKKNW